MNPIFIVGCQRSGTSVLWKALCQHRNLAQQGPQDDGRPYSATKELWFLGEFFRGRNESQRPHAGSLIDEEFKKRFAKFVDQYLEEKYAKSSRRWISAYPRDGLYVEDIIDLYPSAKILFLLRHPQEVVWSAGHAPWVKCSSRIEFLLQAVDMSNWWRRFAEIAVKIYEGKFKDQVMVVRHEQIVANPEKTIKNILLHLNESYQEDVAKCLTKVFNSSFAKVDAPQNAVLASRKKIANDKRFCRYIITQVGDLMTHFGYDDISGEYNPPCKFYRPKKLEIKLLRKIDKYIPEIINNHLAVDR